LIPIGERVWIVPGGVNIGVLANEDGQIVLVDTGLNDTSAKKALKAVREELGGEVLAILTTHAHADHYGGNATVVKRTGAKVHAPAFDEAFLRYPLLQPIFLYGGADPLDTLRGRFLLADPSPVDVIVQPGPHEVAGIPIEAIPLFGHSPGQLGYMVADVFFCADVVRGGPAGASAALRGSGERRPVILSAAADGAGLSQPSPPRGEGEPRGARGALALEPRVGAGDLASPIGRTRLCYDAVQQRHHLLRCVMLTKEASQHTGSVIAGSRDPSLRSG
jgi:glyoxylase-like metal-dependent hydrolase (beta-lactamase superfamily II)